MNSPNHFPDVVGSRRSPDRKPPNLRRRVVFGAVTLTAVGALWATNGSPHESPKKTHSSTGDYAIKCLGILSEPMPQDADTPPNTYTFSDVVSITPKESTVTSPKHPYDIDFVTYSYTDMQPTHEKQHDDTSRHGLPVSRAFPVVHTFPNRDDEYKIQAIGHQYGEANQIGGGLITCGTATFKTHYVPPLHK